MGGGLMQLVAYGAQDVYLTGNPQITFWKVTYRRHTNFAMESIEQTFNGQADFGRRVTCTISRNGDLAYRTYLQVTLPEINQQMLPAQLATLKNDLQNDDFDGDMPAPYNRKNGVYARWLDFPGHQLISMVEVEIGGQRIDRQYGDWMHIWNQLCLTSEQQRGYYKMVGNTTQLTFITDPNFAPVDGPCATTAPPQVCAPRNALPETTLYIPFQFWYCRNPGLALPLIALQYHEIRINLDLRPIDECLWAVTNLTSCKVSPTKVATAYQQSLVAASLYVDYVFLDTDERRRMAQNPHEYLIEQLQFTGDESVGSSSNKIKLNFNHPCKELIWVVQPDANVDYCASLICGTPLFDVLGAQPFNYTDAIDSLPNAIHAFGGPRATGGYSKKAAANAVITSTGKFDDAGADDVFIGRGWGYGKPNFKNNPLGNPNQDQFMFGRSVQYSGSVTLRQEPRFTLISFKILPRLSQGNNIEGFNYTTLVGGEYVGDEGAAALGNNVGTMSVAAMSYVAQLYGYTGLQFGLNTAGNSARYVTSTVTNEAGEQSQYGHNVTVTQRNVNLVTAIQMLDANETQAAGLMDSIVGASSAMDLATGTISFVVSDNQPGTQFTQTGTWSEEGMTQPLSWSPGGSLPYPVLTGVPLASFGVSSSRVLWQPAAQNVQGESIIAAVMDAYTNLNGSDSAVSVYYAPSYPNLNSPYADGGEYVDVYSDYEGEVGGRPEVIGSNVSDAGTFVLNETSLEMHCWGENPVVTAKLQLNGQDRFSEREGTYFDLVQPYQHHTRNPDTGINVYSFALRPEEHQPSGTCNFSRIDNATLQLVLSNATVGGTNTAKVRVYATNYNVLRIMSGMGGLAYSN